MSYSLAPYLVDIGYLRQVCGSGDLALLDTLKEHYGAEFDEQKEWFEEEIRDGAPTPWQAVVELIDGTLSLARWGSMYGYSLEYVCRHLGELLDNTLFESIRGRGVLETIGLADSLMTSGPPISLPAYEGFPIIGHFDEDRVGQELHYVCSLGLFDQDEYTYHARQQYAEWLEEGLRRKKGIVSFYY